MSAVRTLVDLLAGRRDADGLAPRDWDGVIGAARAEAFQRDLPDALDRLIPPSRDYGHEQTWHDGNGHSHLQATLLGPSLTAPVAEGKLLLGTWQQIVHLECDVRPRQRTVVVTVLGDM